MEVEKAMPIHEAAYFTEEENASLTYEQKNDCLEKGNLLDKAMASAFRKTKNRKLAIYLTAAAGGAIAAKAPPVVDVWLLRTAEVIMVILLANSYGEKLTKAAFKGVCLSSTAQLIGESVALTTLEAFKLATLGAGVVVKAAVATGLIVTVGNCVVEYYEHPESACAKACKIGEVIGAAADSCRCTKLILPMKVPLPAGTRAGKAIAAPKLQPPSIAELQEKVDNIQRTINSIVKQGGSNPSSKNLSDLNDALRQLEEVKRELQRALANQ